MGVFAALSVPAACAQHQGFSPREAGTWEGGREEGRDEGRDEGRRKEGGEGGREGGREGETDR
jgi:hypothetical protein